MGIVAAAVSVGTAVATGIGAAGAAIAAISVSTAFEVAAGVGAVLGVVGTVTHDKTLSMIGLAIGAVGGIGALASSAGLLGADAASGAPLFGAAPAASTADAASAGTIDSLATGDASGLPGEASGLSTTGEADSSGLPPGVGTGDATGNVVTAPAADAGTVPVGTDMAPQDAAAVQSNVAGAQASGTSQNGLVIGEQPISAPTGPAAAANPLANAPPGTATANASGQVSAPQTSAGEPSANPSGIDNGAWGSLNTNPDFQAGREAGTQAAGSGLGSAVDGILSFSKNSPLATYGILQAGGSLLSGLTSTLTPAQVSALNAQAAANNAATALTTQQTANLAGPKSVAQSAPVTGTPATLVPGASQQAASSGFINQPITGKPLTQAA